MKKNSVNVIMEAVEFIPLSSLVPAPWDEWFYNAISENAPFSWGDNNRTLVTADRLARHCDRVGLADYLGNTKKGKKAVERFMKMLGDFGTTYVDLEN